MNGNEVREGGLPANALQQDARGGGAHLIERLANRGEARIVKRSALDVVEANDRDIGRNVQSMVHESANRTDGGDVVVAEERREIGSALDEFVGWLEAEFWSGDAKLKLHDKLGRDGQLEIAGNRHQAIPAIVRVGAVAAAAHEGDLAVSELVEMAQGKLGGALLVEDDVGDAFDFAMAGDDNGGENAEALFKRRIDKDEAFDGAIHEKSRVLFDEVGLAAVARGEVEIALLDKVLFDAAEDLHRVAVTEFGNEDADGESLALAQGPCKKAGAIVELGSGLRNAVAGFLRDGADSGGVIQTPAKWWPARG